VLLRARLIKIINQSCYLALIFSTPFCLKITTIFSYHFYEDIKTKCQPKKHTVYFLWTRSICRAYCGWAKGCGMVAKLAYLP